MITGKDITDAAADMERMQALADEHHIVVWQDDVYEGECRSCHESVLLHGEAYQASRDNRVCPTCGKHVPMHNTTTGYFWWCCLPGCLPEGDAQGPYETELEALESATEGLS